MGIIVFGHKISQIRNTHRLLQTRVQTCPGFIHRIHGTEQGQGFSAFTRKTGDQVFRQPGIKPAFEGSGIIQIGRSKRRPSLPDVYKALTPQRFEQGEMSKMFPDRPLGCRFEVNYSC